MGEGPRAAEDLGEITPEVDALRKRFGLPGMRILQFAFGGAVEERFQPHTFDHNCVAYTGTHEYNATFTLALGSGIGAGQTLIVPMTFQYERVNPAPSGTFTYALTITLRLPDGTDRIITGALTVSYA